MPQFRSNKRIVFYSRFFQHSITDDEENNFISSISKFSCQGDLFFFEFRLDKDLGTKKVFGNHFRRYESSRDFLEKFSKEKFNLKYSYEGFGVARFKNEDPYVGRFIFQKID